MTPCNIFGCVIDDASASSMKKTVTRYSVSSRAKKMEFHRRRGGGGTGTCHPPYTYHTAAWYKVCIYRAVGGGRSRNRVSEQRNRSIYQSRYLLYLFKGTAGTSGTKLLYGRCRVDYMSHHHHDGGEIPFVCP